MKAKSTITAVIVTAALTISASASAGETPFQGLIANMLKGTLQQVSNEIEGNIKANIFSLNHELLHSDSNGEVVGKVTITDIDSVNAEKIVATDNESKTED